MFAAIDEVGTAIALEEVLWVTGGVLLTVVLLAAVCFWVVQDYLTLRSKRPAEPTDYPESAPCDDPLSSSESDNAP